MERSDSRAIGVQGATSKQHPMYPYSRALWPKDVERMFRVQELVDGNPVPPRLPHTENGKQVNYEVGSPRKPPREEPLYTSGPKQVPTWRGLKYGQLFGARHDSISGAAGVNAGKFTVEVLSNGV